MCGVFSLPDPHNKEKKCDIIRHQSRFTLAYVKCHVKSLQKGSTADQYVVQNLQWLGVYLRSTLPNALIQKLLALVPLTATGTEVFVTTMTIFI